MHDITSSSYFIIIIWVFHNILFDDKPIILRMPVGGEKWYASYILYAAIRISWLYYYYFILFGENIVFARQLHIM